MLPCACDSTDSLTATFILKNDSDKRGSEVIARNGSTATQQFERYWWQLLADYASACPPSTEESSGSWQYAASHASTGSHYAVRNICHKSTIASKGTIFSNWPNSCRAVCNNEGLSALRGFVSAESAEVSTREASQRPSLTPSSSICF